MPGRRRVEHQQVGVGRPLQLLHLPQHEDVLDARRRRGHHIQGAGGHQSLGDPGQPVVAQVVEQSLIGGEGPGPHLAVTLPTTASGQHRLVVGEGELPEHGGQAGLALHLDDQGGQPGLGRGPGEGGAHDRFAHAALPGHDEQPRCCEEAGRVHGRRRYPGPVWSSHSWACSCCSRAPRPVPSPRRMAVRAMWRSSRSAACSTRCWSTSSTRRSAWPRTKEPSPWSCS